MLSYNFLLNHFRKIYANRIATYPSPGKYDDETRTLPVLEIWVHGEGNVLIVQRYGDADAGFRLYSPIKENEFIPS